LRSSTHRPETVAVPIERIENRILLIRDLMVLLDTDLASWR